jgi:hypothetical protein
MQEQPISSDFNPSSEPKPRSIPVNTFLRNFFVDWIPAGQSTRLPLVEALARAARHGPREKHKVVQRKDIRKPYEKVPDYRANSIVAGETTSATRAVARIVQPYSELYPEIPPDMVRQVVGILEDLDSAQVADAAAELRSTTVGQILQDFSFAAEPPLALPVTLSPDLTRRVSEVGKTINQKPLVIFRRKDGTDYCDRKVRSWRLAEGYAHVFSDRPRCPLSWSVPPLLQGYPATSIRELALACLRQQIYLEAMSDIRAALQKCRELHEIEILPPARRATPLPRDPFLPDPAIVELRFRQRSLVLGKIIAVHFGFAGAGPSDLVREEWDKKLSSDERFSIYQYDVQHHARLAISLAIKAVPTIMLYKAGNCIFRGEGALGSREISTLAAS